MRTLEPSDVETIYTWENNVALWHLSNTQKPFAKHVIEDFINDAHKDIYATKNSRFIICKKDNSLIGAIDLFDFEPFHLRVGIGILIADEPNRNKGYASEALKIIIDYAFNILQLKQLYCNINANNENSLRLFAKNNFVISGTKKCWNKTQNGFIDEHFLQLLNTSYIQ